MQLVVTANKLNKRKVIPISFPDTNNITGVVNKNFIFEGEEVTEVPNPALGKWYKDRDGSFYWGGGVMELLLTGTPTDYRKLFSMIPAQWLQTKGRNIKVAVLDTGFNLDHQDLVHLKPNTVVQDFGGNNSTIDTRGHGTHVLGLLGAQSNSDGILGLIPESKFFLYKVMRDNVGFLESFAEKAILDAIDKEVDILNMSFDVPSAENSPLHEAIKKALEKNILVVASAGDNDDLIQSSLIFPSQFEGVVSVGEVSADFGQALHTGFNNQLDFILPFVDQRSCWINDSFGLYHNLKGSSMASALITGILASNMSFTKKSIDPSKELKNISPSFSNSIFNDSKIKIVNP
jgi:major intracellular serine protease